MTTEQPAPQPTPIDISKVDTSKIPYTRVDKSFQAAQRMIASAREKDFDKMASELGVKRKTISNMKSTLNRLKLLDGAGLLQSSTDSQRISLDNVGKEGGREGGRDTSLQTQNTVPIGTVQKTEVPAQGMSGGTGSPQGSREGGNIPDLEEKTLPRGTESGTMSGRDGNGGERRDVPRESRDVSRECRDVPREKMRIVREGSADEAENRMAEELMRNEMQLTSSPIFKKVIMMNPKMFLYYDYAISSLKFKGGIGDFVCDCVESFFQSRGYKLVMQRIAEIPNSYQWRGQGDQRNEEEVPARNY